MSAGRAPRCDMCGFKDGHSGFKLLTCKICKVSVHDRCYGMADMTHTSDFTCWACQSVGEVSEAYDRGKIRKLVQEERPTKCDLCNHTEGIHAMHPLFDNPGKSGRQILMKDPKPRLSWAHSLCCFYLSQKGGSVYGCNKGGDYFGMDEDDDETKNNRPDNTTLLDGYDSEEESGAIHHFVYMLRQPGKPENAWTKAIAESQRQLKCSICGANDNAKGILRIPVQCCANDEGEYEEFRRLHCDMKDDEACTVAMHVGCARWHKPRGGNPPKRVYYHPGVQGDDEDGSEPTMEVYCVAHATEIQHRHGMKRKATDSNNAGSREQQKRGEEHARQERRGSNGRRNQNHAQRDTASHSTRTTVARRLSYGPSSAATKKIVRRVDTTTPLASLQRKTRESDRRSKKRARSKNRATTTKISKKSSSAKKPLPTRTATKNGPLAMTSTDADMLQRAARPRPGKKKFEFARGDAVALSNLSRPSLKTKKTDLASESQKTRPLEAALAKMKTEMLPMVLKLDAEKRREYVKNQKQHWKREFLLPKEKFRDVWNDLKVYLEDKILNQPPPGTEAHETLPTSDGVVIVEGGKEQASELSNAMHAEPPPVDSRMPTIEEQTPKEHHQEIPRNTTPSPVSQQPPVHVEDRPLLAVSEENGDDTASASSDEPISSLLHHNTDDDAGDGDDDVPKEKGGGDDDNELTIDARGTDANVVIEYPEYRHEEPVNRWAKYFIGQNYTGEALAIGGWDDIVEIVTPVDATACL